MYCIIKIFGGVNNLFWSIIFISVLSAFTYLNLHILLPLQRPFSTFLNVCIIFHAKLLQLINKFNIHYRAVTSQIK